MANNVIEIDSDSSLSSSFDDEDFRCPITQEVFEDPVTAADGHVYERKAIVDWLKKSKISPCTNVVLSNKKVTSSFLVKRLLDRMRFKRKIKIK